MNIKAVIAIIAVIICGVSGAFVYKKVNAQSVSVLLDYQLEPLECNLLEKSCSINFGQSQITFDILPRPVVVMDKTTIRISNLYHNFYDPKIRIYGLNMNMGTIIASLKEVKSGVYETQIALSACLVEDVMRYRIALFDGNDPMNLFVDFDIAL